MRADLDWDSLVRMVLVWYTIPGRAGCIAKELEVAVQCLVLLYTQAEMDADSSVRLALMNET